MAEMSGGSVICARASRNSSCNFTRGHSCCRLQSISSRKSVARFNRLPVMAFCGPDDGYQYGAEVCYEGFFSCGISCFRTFDSAAAGSGRWWWRILLGVWIFYLRLSGLSGQRVALWRLGSAKARSLFRNSVRGISKLHLRPQLLCAAQVAGLLQPV